MLVVLEMLSWLLTCPFSAPKSVLHTLFRNFYVLNSFASWLPVSSCKPEVPKECWKERGGEKEPPSWFCSFCQLPSHSGFGSNLHLLSAPPERASPAAWVVPVEFWAPVPQGPSLAFQGTIPSSGLRLSSMRPFLYTARFCHLQPLPFCSVVPGVVAASWVTILVFSQCSFFCALSLQTPM